MTEKLIVADPVKFADGFDRHPFYIEHALVHHPLLQLPELAGLSTRLPAAMVEWNSGHAGAYGKPEEIRAATTPCTETIMRIAERPAWVLLRHIEADARFNALLDALLNEIEPLSAPLRDGMCDRAGFIFISSQAAVTPFHFDPEFNFLLQIRGSKTVHMWDPHDRTVLPAPALENYYAGRSDNRNQPYDESFLKSAWILPLEVGQGIHFPLHAPHWVKTESAVSISLSVTFRTTRSKFNEPVYAANGYLRSRFGIRPLAPGKSLVWDASAHMGWRAARKIRTLLAKATRSRHS